MSKFQYDLTQGNVVRQLVKFSWPFLLSNLIQAVYGLADMVVVGRDSGPVGVSAVQISGQLTLIVTNFIIGFAVGGTVLIAQYLGAKRQEDQVQTIGTMLTVFAAASVIITAVMILCADPLLHLLNTPQASLPGARSYLNICMLGTIFIFGYNAIAAIMRALGDSKRPLVFVSIACVTNIVLDIVFVMGLRMGAAGAALATVIAQGMSFLLSLIYLIRNDFIFDFKPRSFRIHGDKLRLIVRIGLPSSLQNVIVGVSFLIVTAIASALADETGASAVGIAARVNSFAILPSFAMSNAISSMVGQNIGAGLLDRAKRTFQTGVVMAFGISVVIFAAVQLFPSVIVGVFFDTGASDPALVQTCIDYLRCASFDYLFSAVSISLGGLLIGAGHTNSSLINALISSVFLRAPFAWLFGQWFGVPGIGFAVALASAGSLVYGGWYYFTGRWKKAKIDLSAPSAA